MNVRILHGTSVFLYPSGYTFSYVFQFHRTFAMWYSEGAALNSTYQTLTILSLTADDMK